METIDAADRLILNALREHGRASVTELATTTGLSASACSRRLRRLEDRRVIRGYKAIIDPDVDGHGLTAFVAVRLVRHQREHIRKFQDGARKAPEIIECHHVTGEESFVLRAAVDSVNSLEKLTEKLTAYGPTTTSVILSTSLNRRHFISLQR